MFHNSELEEQVLNFIKICTMYLSICSVDKSKKQIVVLDSAGQTVVVLLSAGHSVLLELSSTEFQPTVASASKRFY